VVVEEVVVGEVEVVDVVHHLVADGPLHEGEGPSILVIVVMSVVKLAIMLETAETKEDVLGTGHVPGLQDEEGHTHHQGHAQETGLVQRTEPAQETDPVLGLGPGQPVEIVAVHMTDHARILVQGTAHPLDLSQKIGVRLVIVVNKYL